MTAAPTAGTRRAARALPAEGPGWRFFAVTLLRRAPLGPSTVRLTLTGADLGAMGLAGDDQRVKLVLTRDGDPAGFVSLAGDGDWYARWRALPEDTRPHLRTYTVRAARPERAEVDLDVVLHGVGDGTAGPASRWAATAPLGAPALLLGPDRDGRGRLWGCEWAPPPGAALLLAADETAVPAVAAVLEGLPDDSAGIALLETPHPDDALPLAGPPAVRVRWLPRGDGAPGTRLVPAVLEAVPLVGFGRRTGGTEVADPGDALWDVPDRAEGTGYAWLAGEAGVVTGLRRALVRDLGVPRTSVAFMGYWRAGVGGG
jgi:NADPH-dependent ferric siderophore reductase